VKYYDTQWQYQNDWMEEILIEFEEIFQTFPRLLDNVFVHRKELHEYVQILRKLTSSKYR
jgi:hypothetical protein